MTSIAPPPVPKSSSAGALRFGTRTLLIVVALVALVLSFGMVAPALVLSVARPVLMGFPIGVCVVGVAGDWPKRRTIYAAALAAYVLAVAAVLLQQPSLTTDLARVLPGLPLAGARVLIELLAALVLWLEPIAAAAVAGTTAAKRLENAGQNWPQN